MKKVVNSQIEFINFILTGGLGFGQWRVDTVDTCKQWCLDIITVIVYWPLSFQYFWGFEKVIVTQNCGIPHQKLSQTFSPFLVVLKISLFVTKYTVVKLSQYLCSICCYFPLSLLFLKYTVFVFVETFVCKWWITCQVQPTVVYV